jgi:hypothetical protein
MTISFALSIVGVTSFSAIAMLLNDLILMTMKDSYILIVVGVFALMWRLD